MIEGSVDLVTFRYASGWAADLDCPEEKLVVRALYKGAEIASAVAGRYRRDLEKLGDGGKLAFQLCYEPVSDPGQLRFYAGSEKYTAKLPVLRINAQRSGYQSFEDQKGDSDSFAKLERLGLPERLDGLHVLDLGCNEGFFCINALNRGAASVTGIDASEEYIRRARTRNSRINYIHGSWWEIPDRKYDLILLLSAFHYEQKPKQFLDMLAGHLTPNGMLVLECGVASAVSNQAWQLVQRADGIFRYPSRSLLTNSLLSRYYTRYHSTSIEQSGDPMPRYVYHACLKQPSAILISGSTLLGKTILASLLAKSACVVNFSIDFWLWQITTIDLPYPSDNSIYAKVRTQCDSSKFAEFVDALSASECEEFAAAIFDALPLATECVVIEGYALERRDFAITLERLLKDAGVRVWNLSRSV